MISTWVVVLDLKKESAVVKSIWIYFSKNIWMYFSKNISGVCLLWKNLFRRWITSSVQGWEDVVLKRPLENTKKHISQYTKVRKYWNYFLEIVCLPFNLYDPLVPVFKRWKSVHYDQQTTLVTCVKTYSLWSATWRWHLCTIQQISQSSWKSKKNVVFVSHCKLSQIVFSPESEKKWMCIGVWAVRGKWKKLFDSSDLALNNYQLPWLKLPKLFQKLEVKWTPKRSELIS